MKSIYKGFNLLELLISLVIIAILVSIATPFSSNIIAKWQIKSVAEDIESAVALARDLALAKGKIIYIEAINKNSWSSGIQVVCENNLNEDASEACNKAESPSAKNIYSQQLGFQRGASRTSTGVYIGVNEDASEACNKAESPSAKSIVHIFQWSYPKLYVTWIGFQHKNKIRFTDDLINASSNGHFLLEIGNYKQKIVINRIGRIRIC